ncbi:beta-propeller domain-containing protein [Thermodesulfobacteriota bacterium]
MDTCLHRKIQLIATIFLCLALVYFAGCIGTEVGNPEKVDLSLSGDMTGFSNNAQLEVYLKEQYRQSVYSDYPYALESNSVRSDDVIDEDFDSGDDAGGAGPDAPVADSSNGYTGTNLQEAGVDEADVVKTDGEFLYVAGSYVSDNADRVSVVRAASPMLPVSTIRVKGSVSDMYLYDHLLVILYSPLNYEGQYWVQSGVTDLAYIGIPYWIPIQSKTGIAVFDVTDPATPIEQKTIEIDGYLVSSRRIANKLHVVQQYLPNLPPPYLLENIIDDMTLEELIPYYADITGTNEPGERIQLVAPGDFFHPDIDGGGSIVSLITLDLDDLDQPLYSTGVVADASIVYASTRALYFTSTYWNYQTTGTNAPVQQTIIYKFDLTGEQVRGQGFVAVTGRALNQFSLGEHGDVLRIATTTGWPGGSEPTARNHVYCVGMQDGKLGIIGKLQDLAPGEEIYAARFMGTRGYLVTFVTIDPLFTLDLSDPADPKVVGELKVPGYSDYIHPYGENHLITMGKDALEVDGNAWYQGVQLSIFDISNFSEPKLLHTAKIGDRGSTSEALDNHKAFTFWEENGLLAVPIDLYEHENLSEYPWQWGTLNFKGLYVYRVGIEVGFEFVGRIATLSELDQYWNTYGSYTRGTFIDERVYAVTSSAVRSAKVTDIQGTLELLVID